MYLAKRFSREFKYAGTAEINKLNFDGGNSMRRRWGGDEEKRYDVVQPTPIPQPTAYGTVQDWQKAMPLVYQTQSEYLPKFGQLAYDVQKQLYPQVAGLTENLAGQAVEGMKGEVPSDVQQYYSDTLKAQFGRNLMNPQGQQAYGIGMTNLREQYKNYYQNMALQLLGLNPTVANPDYNTMTSNMTAGNTMNFNAGNYGTYASYMRPIVQPNYNQNGWQNTMGAIGGGLAGIGSLYSAFNPRPVNYNSYGYIG